MMKSISLKSKVQSPKSALSVRRSAFSVQRSAFSLRRSRAVILILVLWLLVILSLIGLSYTSTVRTSIVITGNRANKIKARWYAKAGVERAISELLQRTDTYYSEQSGFYNDEALFANQPIGDGTYSLVLGRGSESGELVYGITDEAGRLNVNTATEEALFTFPEMTVEMGYSLLDWRDADYETRPDGAEDDYYQMLDDPYPCKNRLLQTVGELLLVRGWTAAALFGEDANENGVLDPNEDDGDQSSPTDDADGELDKGLYPFLTVYSRDREINPDGQMRLDLNSATEQQLQQIEGVSQTAARSIVAWRNQNRFQSLADLLNVTEAQQGQDNQPQGSSSLRTSAMRSSSLRQSTMRESSSRMSLRSSPGQSSQGTTSGQSGNTVLTVSDLAQMSDWVCAGTEDKRNRINVNTAPLEVLVALPGMTEDLANAIITHRSSSIGPFMRRSDLLSVSGMTDEVFRQIIDYVTVQSYQFRIVAEGHCDQTKAKVEVVVDIASSPPKILYMREL